MDSKLRRTIFVRQNTNDMTHTKGSWFASEPKISEVADGQTYFSIQSKNPERRGETYVMPGFYYPHSVQTTEEMKANAKLIAAAPDLLDALIALINAKDSNGNIHLSGNGKIIQEIELAIRKATL